MFARLTAACGEVGRDPASIRRTSGCVLALGDAPAAGAMAGVVRGSDAAIVDWLAQLRSEGVDHLTVWLWPWTARGVEQLGPIVEAAHALG
jgi:hypothetical protein